ncbi:MAG: hypothetical protein AAFN70_21005, partial [Planctomycetota bacterium]
TRIGFDVLWYQWARSFDRLDLRLRDPDNPAFAPLIGAGIVEPLPLGWKDSVSLRFGFEEQYALGRTIRLGYVHQQSPLSTSLFTPYLPATLDRTFSVGHGWNYGPWGLDVAYQYSYGPRVFVGNSGIIGSDFSGSHSRTRLHTLMASIRYVL